MNPVAFPGNAIKHLFSTQDVKISTVINTVVDETNKTSKQNADAKLNSAMEAFRQAKGEHESDLLKLEGINQDITRNEQEIQNAQEESSQAEQTWRSLFRELKGSVSPKMKAEHLQMVSNRELLGDLITLKSGLVADLKKERETVEKSARQSGVKLIDAHRSAMTIYADIEWSAAIQNIPLPLIRAFGLRLRTMRREGDEHPVVTLIEELGRNVRIQNEYYLLDMSNEPVISELGISKPVPGVDMSKYMTPAQSNAAWHKRNLERSKEKVMEIVNQARKDGDERR